MLVLLGSAGWDNEQLKNLNMAMSRGIPALPVLIGEPPKDALRQANSLYTNKRPFDLRSDLTAETIDGLTKLILKTLGQAGNSSVDTPPPHSEMSTETPDIPGNAGQYDALINTLIDGDEEDRFGVLLQIRESKNIDRPALSLRLREEITGRFNPGNSSNFAKATRDPKKITSIRSWMISSLIWTDAEDPDNRNLLLNHLQSHIEPEDFSRFWLLSGLYLRQPSYLGAALEIAQKDDMKIMVLLAEAIQSADSPGLINRMAEMILKGDFGDAWMALRVLRIVAIPQLAPVLRDKLLYGIENPLDYDLLYAMSHPAMAPLVAPLLEEKPGLPAVTGLVAAVTRNSDANATRNFAFLLQHFDPGKLKAEMTRLQSDPVLRMAVDRLTNALKRGRDGAAPGLISIPGYRSDTINVNQDSLDIAEDVATLTAVIMAKDVHPPLTIGLFGDWGSGKSFFMQSVRAKIEKMSEKYRADSFSRFHSHFVHIEFNAWHYIDTNLMASLVSTIFEELAAHVSPQESPEEKQKNFLSQLASVEVYTKEAEAEITRTKDAILKKEQELVQLRKTKKEMIRLAGSTLFNLERLLEDHDRKKLEETLNQLGITDVTNAMTNLGQVIADLDKTGVQASTLLRSIVHGRNRVLVIALLAIIVVGIPGTYYLLNHYLDLSPVYAKISAISAEVAAMITGLTVTLNKGLRQMQQWLGTVKSTKEKIDKALEEKRAQPGPEEKAVLDEIALLKIEEDQAEAQLAAAHARMAEIEDRLQRLKEEQSLTRFLYERSHTDDYRKYLGLISTVRKDFSTLTERLKPGKAGSGAMGNPVDRIILYIDDLDRCPSEKVIEVLQAVHLLLAYPLFVVLVGVDPRWLLHSLGKTYDPFKIKADEKNGSDAWLTTPQNFIEKIFQIPYNLKPMSDTGFETLMHTLLGPSERAQTDHVQEIKPSPDSKPTTDTVSVTPDNKAPDDARSTSVDSRKPGTKAPNEDRTETQKETTASDQPKGVPDTAPTFEINEDSLVIRDWESKYAFALLPFIPTPRAAKRFTNIYRILKASVHQKDLALYEGSAELPGNFQLPMVLLALLTGLPEHAPVLFESLSRTGGETIPAIFTRAMQETKGFSPGERAKSRLEELVTAGNFPSDKTLLADWLPRVARFSFEAGKVGK